MMYRVIILSKAIDDLSKLDKTTAKRIIDKLTWLSENIENIIPLPLKGSLSRFYKLKIGDWRVIYEIGGSEKIITIHKIGIEEKFINKNFLSSALPR